MDDFIWFNEPKRWGKPGKDSCIILTDPKTDFWRTTHYGFIRDNGHFLYQEVSGDFELEAKITGNYVDQYDQAGIMLRQDSRNWLKTGIEYVDGYQQVSAVVTREYSDWSVRPLEGSPAHIWLKLIRKNDFVEIFAGTEKSTYTLTRIAYLAPSPIVLVGPMAASPEGNGFEVTVSDYRITSL